ncbi:hypothetical protein BDEG_20090 [Batrachochytrium dendrobatidis JEL423]|nr:hypothetical protein BDEG_20090 [Batrachochytrium dendrobatidis JEL423]
MAKKQVSKSTSEVVESSGTTRTTTRTTTTTTTTTTPKLTTSNTDTTLSSILTTFEESYFSSTPQSIVLIDVYLAFVMLTGIIQFLYVVLAGTYPYNSFLAGFICSVGSFVLAVNLRIQAHPANRSTVSMSPER